MQKECAVRKAAEQHNAVRRNMADAIGYLCSVAAEAGLDNIASRLAAIRSSLQKMVGRRSEPGTNDWEKRIGGK
jgi:hypothetical protein